MAYEFFDSLKHSFDRPQPFIRREGRRPLSSLNLIVCCAGWGKTAYLSQLAEDNKGSVCISAGAEDNSSLGLIRLLSQALPEAGITGDDSDYEAVSKAAEALSADGGRLLLFDNASIFTDDRAVSLLGLIAKAAAAGKFRAVFAARSIPAFLTDLVFSGNARLFGIAELRFTRTETARLAEQFADSPEDIYINSLQSFTGGWCAAVSALARIGGEPSDALYRSFLPQYIKSNILSGLSSELKNYLYMSAFIPSADDEISKDVFGVTDGKAVTSELISLGIASGEEQLYPEALRLVLSSFLPSEKRSELVKRAADHFIRNKRFAEAASLFEAGGDSRSAERVLRLYGSELLSNCEFELIGYCGGIIGRPESISDPEVLGILAQYHYYKGEYDRMERAYNLADSMFGKENRFAVYRMLYKGLLGYDLSPEMYAGNIRNAAAYLSSEDLSLPFLYDKERTLFDSLTKENTVSPQRPMLSVFRFGDLRVLAGAEMKEIMCKTRRSIELIAFLLENQDRTVGRDEILSAFWPEDMPANAVAMLHNMIYNLRRELSPFGLENIISYKNKSYMLDMSMIGAADEDILSACKCADKGDTISLLEHEIAAESYWGRFLGNIDSLWAREKKEYYDRCYVKACRMLSEHYRSVGELDRELLFLKNALRLDPYSEQLVHDIIVCCSALGQPDKANKYYDEYSARLDADFGTRPSNWLRNKYLCCFADK